MKHKVQPHAIPESRFSLDFLSLLLLMVALLYANSIFAAPVGKIINISDSSQMYNTKADGTIEVLNLHSTVDNGDVLVTQGKTYAKIQFIDDSTVTLAPNTRFKVINYAYNEAKPKDDHSVFKLITGTLRSISGKLSKRNPDSYKLETPAAVIGIRGTDFTASHLSEQEIKACQEKSTACKDRKPGLYAHVKGGSINVANSAGSKDISAGQSVYAAANEQVPVESKANPNGEVNLIDKKPGAVQCSIK